MYSIGVIGGGEAIRMATPALRVFPSVAIHDIRDTSSRFPEFTYIRDLNQLLEPNFVQAVYLATPVDTHRRLIELVADSGLPALIEKPLTTSFAEAAELGSSIATEQLFVAFRKRYSNAVRSIRAIRAAGAATGHLDLMWLAPRPPQMSWKLRGPKSGGGVTLDLASHAVDLIEFSLSEVAAIEVMELQFESDSSSDIYLDARLRLMDDSTARIRVGWATDAPLQLIHFREGDQEVHWFKDASHTDSLLYSTLHSGAQRIECRRNDEYTRMFAEFGTFIADQKAGNLADWATGERNMKHLSAILEA